MKKYFYILLLLIIFITGIWILNNFGIISLKAWGEKTITSTPFLEEYVKTDMEYSEVFTEKQELEARNNELIEINSELENSLKEARQQLETQQEKIEILEEELTILKEEKGKHEQRISKLVEIYSKMDPGKAAEIIIGLDRDLSLILLTRLKDEQAANILSELPSEEAVVLTEAINNQE